MLTVCLTRSPSHDARREGREAVEALRRRAVLLGGAERALMTMVLDSGQSVRQIATLTGISPTTISRRIRRIATRLADNTYPACQACSSQFDALELAVIRDHFVRGLPLARISRQYGLTYYRVRAATQKARRCARATGRTTQWRGPRR